MSVIAAITEDWTDQKLGLSQTLNTALFEDWTDQYLGLSQTLKQCSCKLHHRTMSH